MAEEEEVIAFLNKLKTLDSLIYCFQKDVVLNSRVVQIGWLDRSEVLGWYETRYRNYTGRAPFQGMNVGNAKNLSHDELDKITNNFSDCVRKVEHARFYRGFMDDGQEVTVKSLNFRYPRAIFCVDYPRNFHDEIVLLERSELKSCPFLVKLRGFCFEKKLALVYDVKFKRSLRESCRCAEFGWKDRMKVANDYALLLKTLTVEKLDLEWTTSDDIMIDEEYNIKLVNFKIGCRTGGTSSVAVVSDDAHEITERIAKIYVLEFGVVLVELIMKWVRDWDHMSELCLDIAEREGGSAVHESLEVDVDTGTEITKLIRSCVRVVPAERPNIDYVISELKRIVGS